MIHYLKVWLACARYSLTRALMFRGDLLIWSLVELFWMSVNLLTITVIYQHTADVAGWSKYEMMLLVGTSMLIQRILMGFFWSSIFEMGRNVRTGDFDFMLAQPGNVLFMASTRKLDLDGLINGFIAIGVIVYSAQKLHLDPGLGDVLLYSFLVLCGLAIHYGILVLSVSLVFWLSSAQGVESGYFTLIEFSRLPRQAIQGLLARSVFVYALPAVIVSNAPASAILHGFNLKLTLWLAAAAVAWFGLAVWVFQQGLRRYASASS